MSGIRGREEWGMKAALAAAFFGAALLSFAPCAEAGKKPAQDAPAAQDELGEKTYANEEFKFSLRYPADWKATERREEIPYPAGVGRLEISSVCFGPKRCEAGRLGSQPQAHLIVAGADAAGSFPAGPRGGKVRARRAGGEVVSDCDVVEKMNVKWAGAGAQWVAMRCPEKRRWRYTATVTMRRTAAGGGDTMSLMCTMLSDSREKEASLAEYDGELKPRCRRIVSTTKFTR